MSSQEETDRRIEKEEQIAKRRAAERAAANEIVAHGNSGRVLTTLERAKAEIEQLRARNNTLEAIARTLDIFDRALNAGRNSGQGYAGGDITYELSQQIAVLKREQEANMKPAQDRAHA